MDLSHKSILCADFFRTLLRSFARSKIAIRDMRCFVDFPFALGYIFAVICTRFLIERHRKGMKDGHSEYGGHDEAGAEDAGEDGAGATGT